MNVLTKQYNTTFKYKYCVQVLVYGYYVHTAISTLGLFEMFLLPSLHLMNLFRIYLLVLFLVEL